MSLNSKVVEDSIWKHVCESPSRITTISATVPRFIWPQILTHRVFSRNAQSSRAIPTKKLLQQVFENPVVPVAFKKNKRGMQGGEELREDELIKAKSQWLKASKHAYEAAKELVEQCNVHKEVANRILEPFMTIDVVITSTQWDNFLKLRCAEDSQPEIQSFANQVKEALNNSTPCNTRLHAPFVSQKERAELSDEKIMLVSSARCARVSYKNHDGTQCNVEKDLDLAQRLLDSRHLSPFEHCAKAGIFGTQFYANFRGWKSYRNEFETKK